MSRFTSLFLVSLLISLPGCSDDTEPNLDHGAAQKDGGGDGPILKEDGLSPDQKLTVDQVVVDQKVVADQKVTPDQKVTVDMPILPAKDLKPFTLASTFSVIQRFNDPITAGASAFNFAGNELYLFEGGGTTFTTKVSMATISATSGVPGVLSTVFSAVPTLPVGESAFAGGYLALSPKKFAAVGYSTSKTFTGEVIWGDKGITTPKVVAKAAGNYDVLFLDDKTMLVNGTGLGATQSGQGVYLYEEGKTPRLLIKDLGTASGHLALGATTLYAGGYFSATYKSLLYGFSLAEVKAAISGTKTLSASTDGDLIYDGSTADAAAVQDDLVIITLDSSWMYKEVSRIPITVAGDKLTKATAVSLVSGGSGSTISMLAGNGGKQLGLYIKGASSKEIAIISKK